MTTGQGTDKGVSISGASAPGGYDWAGIVDSLNRLLRLQIGRAHV